MSVLGAVTEPNIGSTMILYWCLAGVRKRSAGGGGDLKPTSQENEPFIYASKLIPEDGILKHWNYTTEDIINRNIIFSRPLGTGLKMELIVFAYNYFSYLQNTKNLQMELSLQTN